MLGCNCRVVIPSDTKDRLVRMVEEFEKDLREGRGVGIDLGPLSREERRVILSVRPPDYRPENLPPAPWRKSGLRTERPGPK